MNNNWLTATRYMNKVCPSCNTVYPNYREVCNSCDIPTQDVFDLVKLKKEITALIGSWTDRKLALSDSLSDILQADATLLNYFEGRALITNINSMIDRITILLNEFYPLTRYRNNDSQMIEGQELLVTQNEKLKTLLRELKETSIPNPFNTALQTYAAKYANKDQNQAELVEILTTIDHQLNQIGNMQKFKEDYIRFQDTLASIPANQISMSLRHTELEYKSILDQLSMISSLNLK